MFLHSDIASHIKYPETIDTVIVIDDIVFIFLFYKSVHLVNVGINVINFDFTYVASTYP